MKTLIGITGQKYAGKDTTANYVAELTDYPLYSFASPLKQFCKAYFNLSEEEVNGNLKETTRSFDIKDWRESLSSIVSFYFPKFLKTDKEVKLDYFYRKVFLPYLLSENEKTQSVRLVMSPREIMQRVGTNFFRNFEYNFWVNQANEKVKDTKALIIPDVRFDNEAEWIKENNGIIIKVIRELENNDSHISEKGVDLKYIDVSIENNGSIEELKNGTELLVEYYIKNNNTLSIADML